jgi:excisionase family DNA binding protein
MSAPVLDEPLWTIQQLSEYLQVPVKTIRKWRETGDGPRALTVGRHLRWRRTDVMQWVESC